MIARAVVLDIRKRNYIALLLLSGALVYLFWGMGDLKLRGINYEASQQAAEGLRAFSSVDWGYTRLGFHGYPMRQYLILALPSAIFGRSMTALHFAYDFIVATCVLVFYAGMRLYTARRGLPALLATFPLLAVFCSQYILEYALTREQAIMPPAFAMAACGWFAVFCSELYPKDGRSGLADRGVPRASAAAFTFCAAFLGSMYTPGLALSFFSVYSLLYLLVRYIKRETAAPLKESGARRLIPVISFSMTALILSMAAYIAVTSLFTLLTIRNTNSQLSMDEASFAFILDAVKQVITERPVGLYRHLTPVVIVYAALSALGIFSAYDVVTVIWAFFSICIALIMQGVTPGTDIAIQRAMVIIPVVSTILVYRFTELLYRGHKVRLDGVHGRLIDAAGVRRVISVAAGMLLAGSAALNLLNPRPLTHIISIESSKTLTYVTMELQKKLRSPDYYDHAPILVFFPGGAWDGQIRDYTCYMAPELSGVLTPDPLTYDGAEDAAHTEHDGLIFCATGDAEIPAEITRKYGPPRVDRLKLGGYAVNVSWIFVSPAPT
jgi:hypothetical protein